MAYTEIVSVLRVKAIQVVISDDKVKSDTEHLQFFLIDHRFQLTEYKKYILDETSNRHFHKHNCVKFHYRWLPMYIVSLNGFLMNISYIRFKHVSYAMNIWDFQWKCVAFNRSLGLFSKFGILTEHKKNTFPNEMNEYFLGFTLCALSLN